MADLIKAVSHLNEELDKYLVCETTRCILMKAKEEVNELLKTYAA